MKKYASVGLCFMVLFAAAGCSVYNTVVSERNVEDYSRDDITESKVRARFIEDNTVKASDISVSAYGGHVYLVGEYDTAKQRDRAVALAGNVSGVKSVSAYLLPRKRDARCGEETNLAISSEAKAKIIRDGDIRSANVDVKAVQCNVVLLGVVGSKQESIKAVSHAWTVSGVKDVKSYLIPARQ